MADEKNVTQILSRQKPVTALAMILLLGAGGLGAAIGAIMKGFEIAGVVTVIVCASFALSFYALESRDLRLKKKDLDNVKERTRMQSLEILNNYYVEIMVTIGDFLIRNPKTISPNQVLKGFSNDLREYARLKHKGELAGSTEQFQKGVDEIALKWEEFASRGAPAELLPEPMKL